MGSGVNLDWFNPRKNIRKTLPLSWSLEYFVIKECMNSSRLQSVCTIYPNILIKYVGERDINPSSVSDEAFSSLEKSKFGLSGLGE